MAQPGIDGSTWIAFKITKIRLKGLHVNLSRLSPVTPSCFREAMRNISSYSKHGMDSRDETKLYTYGSGRNGAPYFNLSYELSIQILPGSFPTTVTIIEILSVKERRLAPCRRNQNQFPKRHVYQAYLMQWTFSKTESSIILDVRPCGLDTPDWYLFALVTLRPCKYGKHQ
jgi:hypothetical protein